MNIYNYDKITFEYINTSEAKPSPLEKNVYLIPANATDIKVIDEKEGFVRCFNRSLKKWEYKEDHRGKIQYNKETIQSSIVTYIGEIENNYTLNKPTTTFDRWDTESNEWITNLDDYKTNIKSLINNYTDYKILNNFSHNGIEFYLSMENQFNYKAKFDSSSVQLPPYKVKAKNQYVIFESVESFAEFYYAGLEFIDDTIKGGWDVKDSIDLSSTKEEIETIYQNYINN